MEVQSTYLPCLRSQDLGRVGLSPYRVSALLTTEVH